MIKKILFFILAAFIFCGVGSAYAACQDAGAVMVATQGQQLDSVGDWANSAEVNFVQESELARKMEQAQKAHDAETYDSFGGGITIIAMCIVIGALIVLSILFYFFGSISSWFMKHKKKKTAREGKVVHNSEEDHSPASGETFAAIAAALKQHLTQDHDMEDTILTIRRMRKAYSPWNSKIYNMRPAPELTKHSVKIGKK